MADKATETTGARASTHLIQYSAFTPDDGETRGIATVTAVGDRVPFSQLAAIPGFREGDVLRSSGDDPRPMLLGPGTDAPGHPVWCRTHDAETGDGTSCCHSGAFEVDDELGSVGASLSASTGSEQPQVYLGSDGHDSAILTLAGAREYAELLLALVAQAEAETAVAR